MNGPATFRRFVKGGTVEVVNEVEEAYKSHFGGELGFEGEAFGHPPSFEVLGALNKIFARELLQRQGLVASEYMPILRLADGKRYEAMQEMGLNPVHFGWVMKKTGFNNVSAGTGLVALEQLAHERRVQPGGVHLILGLGVGSSHGAHKVYFGGGVETLMLY